MSTMPRSTPRNPVGSALTSASGTSLVAGSGERLSDGSGPDSDAAGVALFHGEFLRGTAGAELDLRGAASRVPQPVPGQDVRRPVRRGGPSLGSADDRGGGDGAAAA